MLRAAANCERLLQRPCTIVEIYSYAKLHGEVTISTFEYAVAFLSLFREDMVRADDTVYWFSVERMEGYRTFSEMWRQKYPDFSLDRQQTAVDEVRLAYQEVVSRLKSKSCDMVIGEPKLLDGAPLQGNKIGMTGAPRSGTNFLRKIIE
jgi:hypothetical protein